MNKRYFSSRTYGILILLLLSASIVVNAQGKFFNPAYAGSNITDSDYIAKTIIFRINPIYRASCNENGIEIQKLKNVFNSIGAYNILKKFPGKAPPNTKYNKYGEELEDLSLIYELEYTKDIALETAINSLLSTNMLEYAEPHYLPHLLYVPNDPCADTSNASFKQWHLKNIRAYQAWEIQKGDTNIVIGIDDTGVDLLNPDLIGNIKKNYADPVNGIDDDGDGFKDNYYGWDFGENDSCPQWHYQAHGMYVSGLAAASTDNSIDIAGVGFECKFLPVKIDNENGWLTMAYEGIIYAVEHGCKIVNCSWGGGGSGQFGQSIINYAANNMDALVVAACGNSNNSYPMYPAAYNNVFSVAATDINDHKWIEPNGSGSSYGTTIDIAAPGCNIYSTGCAAVGSGTSMAAPIVCGAAAILKAHFPNYSAAQIVAQLQASADNIDTIPANIPYAGLLGAGRLNMFKALTQYNPWILMISKTIADNNDQTFVGGDTLRISGAFKNYLDTSSSFLKVTLSTQCSYAVIIDSISLLGVINTLGTKDNFSDPFDVNLLSSIPVSTQIDFKLTFEDQSLNYKSIQYFSIIVNVDYIDIDTNKVGTTMTSKGKIGYNQQESLSQGIGFTYNGSDSYLSCGGFMVGTSAAQVSDNVYGTSANSFDNDFMTSKIVHKIQSPFGSDFAAETIFNDSLATSMLNLTVKNRAYAWASFPNDKFVIMEYTIKNHGSLTLSLLYAGLFMDFDMSADATPSDRVEYDATNKMGYTYSSFGGTYAAIKLLSQGPVHHYAFDNDGASSSIKISDGFIGIEKYKALKTNRNFAGVYMDGNDVSDLISTGLFILQPGDSVIVSFALIAGDHLADIQASAEAADQVYNHAGIGEMLLNSAIQLSDIYPNPSNGDAAVDIHFPKALVIDLSIFDINGKKIVTVAQGKYAKGDHQFVIHTDNIATGVYHLRLTCENKIISKDFSIIK